MERIMEQFLPGLPFYTTRLQRPPTLQPMKMTVPVAAPPLGPFLF